MYSPVELSAGYMNVTFPQLSGKDQVNTKANVYVDPAYAPDTAADTDVAVVKLVNPIVIAASKNKIESFKISNSKILKFK